MTHYQLVAQNKFRSWLIMIGFVVVITALGWLLVTAGGYDPVFVVLVCLGSSVWSINVIPPARSTIAAINS